MISAKELHVIKFQLNNREQYQLQSRIKNFCTVANIAKQKTSL